MSLVSGAILEASRSPQYLSKSLDTKPQIKGPQRLHPDSFNCSTCSDGRSSQSMILRGRGFWTIILNLLG